MINFESRVGAWKWGCGHFCYDYNQYAGTVMLRTLPLNEFFGVDLVPQAIIDRPISFFHDQLGIDFVTDNDDLDEYEGAFLTFNGKWAFALRHYKGHPADKTTIYLLREIDKVEAISEMIQEIVRELKLPDNALYWQRSNNPEL